MAAHKLTVAGFAWRLLFALLVVFATYNPEGYSYYHWGLKHFSDMTALKAFAGIVLVIGWTIFIRATVNSLGGFGLFLASVFFATLLWVLVDFGIIPRDSIRAMSYVIQVVISAILAIGMSWSLLRRRWSGQYDVDEIEEYD
ncbi:MAG: DUF6524 family protein [Gammaproteobacteria bacterium]|jgi:hypothetical protein